MQTLRILLQNAVFEVILRASDISPQLSTAHFGPRNALNEKYPATFLVRNVMENTFRTLLKHLGSIWGGSKYYTGANKPIVVFTKLPSFCNICEFPTHKAFRTTPKSMIEWIFKRALSAFDPYAPLGSCQKCSTDPRSGPKSHMYLHVNLKKSSSKCCFWRDFESMWHILKLQWPISDQGVL